MPDTARQQTIPLPPPALTWINPGAIKGA